MPPGSMRNKRLDVLRCVAIVLVLFSHAGVSSRLANAGWVGVDLFFVLSGFLISGLLFGEYKRRGDISFKRFFIRRGFKIYPSFYVFLLVTFAVQWGHHSLSPLWSYLSEIFYFQNYHSGIWLHTWSLAVEEHFYILMPVFLLFLVKHSSYRPDPFRAVPRAFLVVAVACLLFRIGTVARTPAEILQTIAGFRAIQTPTHERIDSLFFGVLLGYIHHFRRGFFLQLLAPARNRFILAIVAAGLLAPAVVLPPQNRFMLTFEFTLLYLGFGTVLILSLYVHDVLPSSIGLVLSPLGSAFAFVGMYSYSIYLWHESVLPWGPGVVRRAIHVRIPQSLYGIFYFVASIAFGILMSRSIEYPVLRLRDRLFPAMQSSAGASRNAAAEESSSLELAVGEGAGEVPSLQRKT